MIPVVTFTHHGLRAAVPTKQATLVQRAAAQPDHLLSLWGDVTETEALFLCVDVVQPRAWLRCRDVEIGQLVESQIMPLSEVLRSVLRDLPYVVGVAHAANALLWLVDLSRLQPLARVECP